MPRTADQRQGNPAENLRRAAALMRERAEAAGQEWNADVEPGDSLHLWVTDYDPSDPTGQTPMQRLVGGADAPWSEHIASWHPAVALAIADLLDDIAETRELLVNDLLPASAWNITWATAERKALAVARAYLGEVS